MPTGNFDFIIDERGKYISTPIESYINMSIQISFDKKSKMTIQQSISGSEWVTIWWDWVNQYKVQPISTIQEVYIRIITDEKPNTAIYTIYE